MTDKNGMKGMLTLGEAAKHMGLTYGSVLSMANEGVLVGAVKVRGRWRVKANEFYAKYGGPREKASDSAAGGSDG